MLRQTMYPSKHESLSAVVVCVPWPEACIGGVGGLQGPILQSLAMGPGLLPSPLRGLLLCRPLCGGVGGRGVGEEGEGGGVDTQRRGAR